MASTNMLRVGCPMWANRAWVGQWFPADTPVGRELETYATWCTTVEGNTTFYAEPSPDAVARWAEQSPDDFKFCFKLPKSITHDRRLRNVETLMVSFLAAVAPLGARLGPIQIQLPASFGPNELGQLREFCQKLSAEFSWAVEVRHPGFFVGGDAERPLDDLLTELAINRVILDSRSLFTQTPETAEEFDAWEHKPRLPVRPVATGQHPLVRLIGQRDAAVNLAAWTQWVPRVAAWLAEGLEPHVFTHTPDNAAAPDLARRFWHLVDTELINHDTASTEPGWRLASLPSPRQADAQIDLFASAERAKEDP